VFVRHDSVEERSPLRPGEPGNARRPELTGEPDLLVTKHVNSAFHGDPDERNAGLAADADDESVAVAPAGGRLAELGRNRGQSTRRLPASANWISIETAGTAPQLVAAMAREARLLPRGRAIVSGPMRTLRRRQPFPRKLRSGTKPPSEGDPRHGGGARRRAGIAAAAAVALAAGQEAPARL
jgi:hypothetical protein